MGILLELLIVVAVVGISAILNGYVLSVLWGWFFVPVLHLPPLSVTQAIGIALVVGFLTKQIDSTKDEHQDLTKAAIASFLHPLIALLMGWIVKGFL